jgi:NDP-sugar pyrophosphorylase family protein
MQAVILAGGLGSRLRPFTEVIPKPLLPIGGKSLLEIQIGQLKRHGCEEVFLATDYKSDYIRDFFGDGSRYGVDLHISKEDKPLGTVGPVGLIADRLKAPFIVMNGDILTAIDFCAFYNVALSLEADLCVTIKRIYMPFDFGKITSDGDYVIGVEEKPLFEHEILAGIYVFKLPLLELIPDDEYFGLDTLIKLMLMEGRPVGKYDLTEYWLDIGQVPDYEKAQKDYELYFGDLGEESRS